jgi:hypothetical protein
MNVISIIYEAAAHAGVSTSSIGPKLGKNRAYVARMKTAGSDPSTANAARMLEACGWKLVALPADEVPEGALEVSPTPTTEEDRSEALRRQAEQLRKQAEALLKQADGK